MEEQEDLTKKPIKGLNAKSILALFGTVVLLEFTWVGNYYDMKNELRDAKEKIVLFQNKQMTLTDQLNTIQTRIAVLESKTKN